MCLISPENLLSSCPKSIRQIVWFVPNIPIKLNKVYVNPYWVLYVLGIFSNRVYNVPVESYLSLFVLMSRET